ncbi:excalibur calcium-binding domain-containing protein [Pseudoalteromonas carrageenovora]|nr:excalibur calcium-binding domain-containing protein [Pseudoalteromonas carrageenovora]MDO6636029.1 excalibur calcium-binding domain-containing protein [Pseudoalteromonas carrageenovora]MDO6646952.1 excalibur calcium-binding domain-containing protein [Pseudoalteromonas carrageenovora]
MSNDTQPKTFINNCPNTKMDGDRDGDPCENDTRF